MSENLFFPCVSTPTSQIRLFIFPHAGGALSAYVRFKKILPPDCDLYIFEMPGRSRPHHLRLRNWDEIAQFVFNDLHPLWDRPALFFGHSMGALVALTALQYLEAEDGGSVLRPPARLLVSAMNAPGVGKFEFGTRSLAPNAPDDEFIATLQNMGGLPHDLLKDPANLAALLSPVRQDLTLLKAFPLQNANTSKINIPITGLLPLEDTLCNRRGLTAWQKLTTRGFKFRFVQGGHFYLLSELDFMKKLLYEESIDLRGEA